MPGLPELQTGFVDAILGESVAQDLDTVVADGLSPGARIQIYTNHVFTTLTDTLETTYPVVCRLVDRRFFGFAADCFIRRHPPVGPCLHEYGVDFPDFLQRFPPCASHPYLPDVARLEWAMNVGLHADDVPPIEPTALASVPPSSVGRLVFRTDPSASWLRSPWPVDRIWTSNQPGSTPDTVDLGSGPAWLEIRRREDAVTLRRLDPAEFAFRAALGVGATLESATDAACSEDPGFDLAEALRAMLAEAIVTGFALQPSEAGDVQ